MIVGSFGRAQAYSYGRKGAQAPNFGLAPKSQQLSFVNRIQDSGKAHFGPQMT